MANKGALAVGAVVVAAGALLLLGRGGKAATEFCCPIDGLCFDTREELEEHFNTEHPHELIDIQWE